MKESIDKIIHADEKAKEILEEVSVYRQKIEEELKRYQSDIEAQTAQKTRERVQADSAAKWEKLEADIKKRTENNQKTADSMERYYQKKKSDWIQTIYANIINS